MYIRDFLKEHSNEGAVIIADSMGDLRKILRGFNRFEDEKFRGISVMNLREIAKELVCAYTAAQEPEKHYIYPNGDVCTMLMYKVLKNQNPTFVTVNSFSFYTSGEILRSLNQIRTGNVTEDFENSKDIKITELKALCEGYEKELTGAGMLDYPMLLRKASDILKTLGAGQNEGAEVKETGRKQLELYLPWSRLPIGVWENLVSEGDWGLKGKEEEFLRLFLELTGTDYEASKLSLETPTTGETDDSRKVSFFKGYGAVNEVAYAVKQLKEEKIPYGDAVLVYAGDEYENVIRGILETEHIPYSFASGMHAMANEKVAFLAGLLNFALEDYSYKALEEVIRNPVFKMKKAFKCYKSLLDWHICWGKEQYRAFFKAFEADMSDKQGEDNEALKAFVDVFLKPVMDAFELSDPGEMIAALLEVMKKCTAYNPEYSSYISTKVKNLKNILSVCTDFDNPTEIALEYLRKLTYSTPEKQDGILVVPFGYKGIYDRHCLIAMGLSVENIDRMIKESPVLSDTELRKYISGNIDTAADRNAKKRESFEQLIQYPYINRIMLGYSIFDTVALLKCSPSLLIREQMKNAGVVEKDTEEKDTEEKTTEEKNTEEKTTEGKTTEEKNTEEKDSKVFNTYPVPEGRLYLSSDNFYKKWDKYIKQAEEAEKAVEAAKKAASVSGTEQTAESVEAEQATELAEAEQAAENAGTGQGEEQSGEQTEGQIGESGTEDNKTTKPQKQLSATAIHTLIECPFEYYYQYQKHIPVAEQQERDGYTWMKPNQKGTFFHEALEEYMNQFSVFLKEKDENGNDTVVLNPSRKAPVADFGESEAKELENLLLEKVMNSKDLPPAPNDTIKKEVLQELTDALVQYVTCFWAEMKANPGKKVLGNEVAFQDICSKKTKEVPTDVADKTVEIQLYDIRIKGFIDRLDGYYTGDDKTLHLEIRDYKSGKYENTADKMKGSPDGDKWVQHYTYKVGAYSFCSQHKAELKKYFGGEIDVISVDKVVYEFPLAPEDNELSDKPYKIFDASGKLDSCENENVFLPYHLDDKLQIMEGSYYSNPAAAMKTIAENPIYREVGNIPKLKYLYTNGTCNYCKYQEICRLKLANCED